MPLLPLLPLTFAAPSPFSLCKALIVVLIWLYCALYSVQAKSCTAQQFASLLLPTQTRSAHTRIAVCGRVCMLVYRG